MVIGYFSPVLATLNIFNSASTVSPYPLLFQWHRFPRTLLPLGALMIALTRRLLISLEVLRTIENATAFICNFLVG